MVGARLSALLAATLALRAMAVRDALLGCGGLQGLVCCCKGPKPDSCYSFEKCPLGYLPAESWGLAGAGPEAPPRCQAKEGPPPVPDGKRGPTVRVVAFWMRHALGCSNVLTAQKNLQFASDDTSPWYPDPPLTDAGILRTKAVGEIVRLEILERTKDRQQPLVFSSYMARAIETAFHSFPWPVHPIPFISEAKYTPCHTPLHHAAQQERLKRSPNTRDDLARLKFDVGPQTHPHRDSERKRDYEQFRSFLPGALQELLPPPPQAVEIEIPVVIVSHGAVMKHNLDCWKKDDPAPSQPRQPRNGEVWVETYEFEWGAWDAMLEPKGCEQLFYRSFFPQHLSELCRVDVERCSDGDGAFMPNAWLAQSKQRCDELELNLQHNILERDKISEEPYVAYISSGAAL